MWQTEFFKNVPTFAICMCRSRQKSKLQSGNSFIGHPVDAHDGTSIENNDNKLHECRVYKYYEEEDFY